LSKIISIGTATPKYRHEQEDILGFMQQLYALDKVENRNLGILAGGLKLLMSKKSHSDSSPWHAGYWRNTRQLRLKYNDEIVEIDYTMGSLGYALFMDNNKYFFDFSELSENQICFTIDSDIKYFYPFKVGENEIQVSDGHHEYTVGQYLLSETGYDGDPDGQSGSEDLVVAPQPGIILDVRVEEGQMVNRGDDLLVIESMKLENTILAGKNGQIRKIAIKAGDKVKKNEPLIFMQDTLN
jgi:biotin carboxyl carrier protein